MICFLGRHLGSAAAPAGAASGAFITDRAASSRSSAFCSFSSLSNSAGGNLANWAIFSTRLIVPTTSRTWASSYSSPLLLETRTKPSKPQLLLVLVGDAARSRRVQVMPLVK